MRIFTVGKNNYRANKLNAFDQLILLKTLAGSAKNAIGPDLVALVTKSWESFEKGERPHLNDQDLISLFGPFLDFVGKMPDADFAKIHDMCLGVAQRGQAENIWSNVMIQGTLMFQDIGAAELLAIIYNVLVENLGGFFVDLPSILGRGEKSTTSP